MFTRTEALRIRAVAIAVALASWSLPAAFGFLAFRSVRMVGIIALAGGAGCLLASLLIGWSLFCPWCCKRLFFVSSMANSPGVGQLMRCCAPYEIVLQGRLTCPHCHSRFALAR